MSGTLRIIDDLLKGRPVGAKHAALIGVLSAALYGACMSSFGAWNTERAAMLIVGAFKAPLVIAVTTAVCLPAFWGLCGATGQRGWFSIAWRCVTEAQAVGAVTLASLGPVVVFLYLSGVNEAVALLVNAGAFGLAAIAAQAVLWKRLRCVVGPGNAPVRLLACWFALYGFVGVQVAWMARPVIVPPDQRLQLLRDDPLTNGYIAVARVAWAAVTGGSRPDESDELNPYRSSD